MMTMKGLADVEKNLLRVGQVAGEKAMRGSLFAATKPILTEAQAIVGRWQSGSGSLQLALGRSFNVARIDNGAQATGLRGGRFVMVIGPRRKARAAIIEHNIFYGRRRRGIFHGHFLEWGHRIGHRLTGRLRRLGIKSARSVGGGRVASRPFMRPALDRKSLQAVSIFRTQLQKRILRALKKQDPGATLI